MEQLCDLLAYKQAFIFVACNSNQAPATVFTRPNSIREESQRDREYEGLCTLAFAVRCVLLCFVSLLWFCFIHLQMKIVMKVQMKCGKCRIKALQIATQADGDSLSPTPHEPRISIRSLFIFCNSLSPSGPVIC